MQALGRAIVERTPVEGLAQESPLGGLRRRDATRVDVIAQSVAAVAPAGVALVNPDELQTQAGSFTMLAALTTVIVVVLLAVTLNLFARRVTSAGSLYTFTVLGLGSRVGIVAGAALAIGYLSIAAVCLVGAASRIATLIGADERTSPAIGAGIVLAMGVLVALVIARGVRLSTRILLVIEIIALAAVTTAAVITFADAGWDLTPVLPRAVEADSGFDAVLAGVAVGLVGFIGFESGTALGAEVRRPLAAIPQSLITTVIVVGVCYLLGAGANTVGGAAAGMGGAGALVDLIVALSFLACALATATALARLCFVMSREGVLPTSLGAISRRGTPAVAAVVAATGVAAPALLIVALGGAGSPAEDTADSAAVLGFLVAYLLAAAAAPAFLARIGEFRGISALPSTIVIIALAATLIHFLFVISPERAGPVWAGAVLLVVVIVVLLHRAHRDRAVAARIGIYDVPTASDSIGGAPGPAPDTVPRRSR